MTQDYFDLPFIYTYDFGQAQAGENYDAFIQVEPDADFHLRYVASGGADGDLFRLYSAEGRVVCSTLLNNFPVIPELVYPAGSVIRFRIENLAQNSISFIDGGPTLNVSKRLFKGVKRFRGPDAESMRRAWLSTGSYVLKPYWIDTGMETPYSTYKMIPLPPPWVRNSSFVFTYQMEFDYELYAIHRDDSGYGDTELAIYDPQGRPLMSDHIYIEYLNITNGAEIFFQIFPTFPVFYPAGSVLKVSALSVADSDASLGPFPRIPRFTLVGSRRIRC
jgi:hypothetical protein